MKIKSKKRFGSFLLITFVIVGLGVSVFFSSLKKEEEAKAPALKREVIELDLFSTKVNGAEIPAPSSIPKEFIQNSPEPEEEAKDSSESYKYINTRNQKIVQNLVEYKSMDFLRKGTRVEILEEKEVQNKDKVTKWVKIKYRKDLKSKEGWVQESSLSQDMKALLPKEWNKLTFDYEKMPNNYANNPKVNVKGIYLNIHSMANEKKLDRLIGLANKTEINAFVIDVKDDNGVLLFKTEAADKYNPSANKYIPVKDIQSIMKKLKDNNIYTIARIVSFKDPLYAKANPGKSILNRTTNQPHTNSDGIIWVSPHDRNLWAYNISVAEEAAKLGFNEVQFDYVRFPASNGGKLDKVLDYRNTTNESKPETIQNYLKYAREKLAPYGVYTSADVYGQIGTFDDDMALGQYWEAVSTVVDYISPMKYPSHYGNGAYGIAVPDAQPYKTIYYSTRDSVNRNENIDHPAVIRPWIQAFTAKWVKGHITYGEKQIKEQIKAMNDLGVTEYLLWNPSNNYTIGG